MKIMEEQINIHCQNCGKEIRPGSLYCGQECYEVDNLDDFDEDDDGFQPCDNCDLPDACSDFGCAIANGVRRPIEF